MVVLLLVKIVIRSDRFDFFKCYSHLNIHLHCVSEPFRIFTLAIVADLRMPPAAGGIGECRRKREENKCSVRTAEKEFLGLGLRKIPIC